MARRDEHARGADGFGGASGATFAERTEGRLTGMRVGGLGGIPRSWRRAGPIAVAVSDALA